MLNPYNKLNPYLNMFNPYIKHLKKIVFNLVKVDSPQEGADSFPPAKVVRLSAVHVLWKAGRTGPLRCNATRHVQPAHKFINEIFQSDSKTVFSPLPTVAYPMIVLGKYAVY